jgi:two-component system sensor histidine kinase EvgS
VPGQEWLPPTDPVESTRYSEGSFDAEAHVAFDETVLLDVLDGDREAASQIVAEFLGDAPRQAAGLREAAAAGDLLLVSRCAHTLKGASACVGAQALRHIAARLEEQAAAGNSDGITDMLAGVDRELDALHEIVRTKGALL